MPTVFAYQPGTDGDAAMDWTGPTRRSRVPAFTWGDSGAANAKNAHRDLRDARRFSTLNQRTPPCAHYFMPSPRWSI